MTFVESSAGTPEDPAGDSTAALVAPTVRRRGALAGLAALGAAVALHPGRVSAQETTTSTAEGDNTTTTTAPPLKPTTADLALLAFAGTAEQAAVDLYTMASEALAESPEVFPAFAENHRQYAQVVNGLVGVRGASRPNPAIVAEFEPAFTSDDPREVTRAAYELESALAATHTGLLGRLQGINGASAVASIQPVEAQMAAVHGQALGLAVDEYAPPLQTTEAALNPARYPSEG